MLLSRVSIFAQNDITEIIEEAKQLYLQKNLSESVKCINRALNLINDELLSQMESIFPDPLKNWRVDPPSSHATITAYTTSLISKCKYFKKGGGQSVEIEIQTDSPRIASIKMAFVNPSMINQLGGDAKIATIANRRCIERFDPIDKFAELIFVPNSSVIISIRGFEMKSTLVIAQYAKKLKWDLLMDIFP